MKRIRKIWWLISGVLVTSLALMACEEATPTNDESGSGGTVRGCGTTIVDNAVSPPAWIHGTWYMESDTNRALPVVSFTGDNMTLGGVNFKEARYASIMSDSATANTYTFRQCLVSTDQVTTVTFRGTSTRVTMVTQHDPPTPASGSQSVLVK